ncbi:MAG: C40 family peptidase, partial [Flammeovirgaceae bacterium]
YKQISKKYFDEYRQGNHAVNHEALSSISHPELGRQFISIGSVLPFYKDGQFTIGEDIFQLENATATQSNDLLITAEAYMHTPYLWGGKSIFGIDCSGFVQQVFKAAKDIKLPRDAYQQAEHGQFVEYADATAGDLAFFENEKGRIIHVGILTDEREIIHASGRVKIDNFNPRGIISKETGKHTHKLSFIKRVSPQQID